MLINRVENKLWWNGFPPFVFATETSKNPNIFTSMRGYRIEIKKNDNLQIEQKN